MVLFKLCNTKKYNSQESFAYAPLIFLSSESAEKKLAMSDHTKNTYMTGLINDFYKALLFPKWYVQTRL